MTVPLWIVVLISLVVLYLGVSIGWLVHSMLTAWSRHDDTQPFHLNQDN